MLRLSVQLFRHLLHLFKPSWLAIRTQELTQHQLHSPSKLNWRPVLKPGHTARTANFQIILPMNCFRLLGDAGHLLSSLVLLYKLLVTRSAKGLSRRTQQLYALVYIARYLDLFVEPAGTTTYSAAIRSFLLVSCVFMVMLLHWSKPLTSTYEAKLDTFKHHLLVLPCLIMAFFINYDSMDGTNSPLDAKPVEVMWTFSIYLEAVAILPQLSLMWKSKSVDGWTWAFVLLRGSYRAFYILNWVFRCYNEPGYNLRYIEWCCAAMHVFIYYDFVCLDAYLLRAVFKSSFDSSYVQYIMMPYNSSTKDVESAAAWTQDAALLKAGDQRLTTLYEPNAGSVWVLKEVVLQEDSDEAEDKL